MLQRTYENSWKKIPLSPDNPVSCPREDLLYVLLPHFIIRNPGIPDGTAPKVEKCPVFRREGACPRQHPAGFFSIFIENEDTGTEIHAAEFRPAGVHRADTYMGCPLPEEGTGNGFFILLLF